MLNKLSGDLRLQYKVFRIVFWIDFIIAALLVSAGSFQIGLLFAIFALLAGSVANQKSQLLNQKTFLDNQGTFLSNQLRIEDKLDVVLEHLDEHN